MNLLKIITLALTIAPWVLVDRETSVTYQKQVVYNSRETPINLSLSPNGKYVEAKNRSEKGVRAVKFGCVVETVDGVAIKKFIESMEHFDLAHIDLGPYSDKSRMNLFAFSIRDEIVRQCKELDALLGVVDVSFADGSSWRIPNTKTPNTTTTTKTLKPKT